MLEALIVYDLLVFVLFSLGVFVCCLNLYLSFLRYFLCKWMGRESKWVSGIPIFGSLLVVIAVAMLHDRPFFFWSGITIAVLDTGGLHWFAGTMLWMYLFHRNTT